MLAIFALYIDFFSQYAILNVLSEIVDITIKMYAESGKNIRRNRVFQEKS